MCVAIFRERIGLNPLFLFIFAKKKSIYERDFTPCCAEVWKAK